ncbi:MAG: lysophospholipid acyltransferase family protein [Clostridia bacterium]
MRKNNENKLLKIEKSPERLLIIDKIKQYEKLGYFDKDVEDDPPTLPLEPDKVDYLNKKLKNKIASKYSYFIARKFVNKMIKEKKLIIKEIIGIENFNTLKTGAVVTCNHFNAFDSFAMQLLFEATSQKKHKFYRTIREGNYTNFSGFFGLLMRHCDTLPLSSNRKTMQKFIESTNLILKRGDFVLMYPEQSMWWNYKKPKPLKKGAFNFAFQSNVPVLPCFITMEDSDIIGDDGFFVQEYTIFVEKPIYVDNTLNMAENIDLMKRKNFEVWKNIYEKFYNTKLEYTTE